MNIFVTSPDPVECARMLDDIRLNKMIVETAQMLSTALWAKGIKDDGIYKPISNSRHPCCLWARKSQDNFTWLTALGFAMCQERHDRRFWREHKSKPIIFKCHQWNVEAKPFPDIGFTPFQNSSLLKHVPDVHLAYRETMRRKWDNDVIEVSWTNRGAPEWRHTPEEIPEG